MTFEYICTECGKVFTKDTLVRCHNQKYCSECANEKVKARNKVAWKIRRDKERKKLNERRNGGDSRAKL